MTMIGALEVNGQPVLFGDFVLTNLRGERTRMTKKIVRVADNCAIAWTGILHVAEDVFSEIFRTFRAGPVAWPELQGVLTALPRRPSNVATTVIGWVIDEKPICFGWYSMAPGDIDYYDTTIVGNGSEAFPAWAKDGHIAVPGLTPELAAMGVYQELMQDERRKGPSNNDPWGFAYEFLVYNGRSFEYLSDVLFVTWVIELDENCSPLRWYTVGPIYRYKALPRFSEVMTLVAVDPSKSESYHNFISPPGDPTPESMSTRAREIVRDPYRLRAEYYGFCLMLVKDGVRCGATYLTAPESTPEHERPMRVVSIDGKDALQLNITQEFIEEVLRLCLSVQ